jgi:hypothetical protein
MVVKRGRGHASEFVRQIRVDKIREEMDGEKRMFISEDRIQFIYI